MKKPVLRMLAGAAVFGALFGGAAGIVAGQGEGHTPVLVCHWVPAHGGSFIEIVVDDDGANGNASLQAHQGHELDAIAPENGVCPGGDPD